MTSAQEDMMTISNGIDSLRSEIQTQAEIIEVLMGGINREIERCGTGICSPIINEAKLKAEKLINEMEKL